MKTLSILVADDEAGIRDLLQHGLERAGHNVTCACTGQEAARLLSTRRFDLVITDIVMPDGDGFELITRVKQQKTQTAVLAISGGGMYFRGAECLKMAKGVGADAVVSKPFAWNQLIAGIEQLIPDEPAAV